MTLDWRRSLRTTFSEANERALDDAAEAVGRILTNLQKQQQENVDRAIRDYRLAGDAAYNDLEFEKAASAYSKALSHTARDRDATQWADLQVRIGSTENALSSRSEGAATPATGPPLRLILLLWRSTRETYLGIGR